MIIKGYDCETFELIQHEISQLNVINMFVKENGDCYMIYKQIEVSEEKGMFAKLNDLTLGDVIAWRTASNGFPCNAVFSYQMSLLTGYAPDMDKINKERNEEKIKLMRINNRRKKWRREYVEY